MKDKINIANIFTNIGDVYRNQGNNPLALEHYQKSLKIHEALNNKIGIGWSLMNMGNIYANQNNSVLALEYYQKSLKIAEQSNNKVLVFMTLGNIGIIYSEQGDFNKALEYYQRSMEMSQKIGDERSTAIALNAMGVVYANQGNNSKALEYHQRSLAIREKIADKNEIAISLNNIADVYKEQGNTSKALEYYQRSLEIHTEMGDKRSMTYPLTGIALIYQKDKAYDKSIEYAKKGLQIAQEIKSPLSIKYASETLYNTYKFKGEYSKALEYHELYKTTNDSLFNVDKSKAIANLETKAEIELLNKNQQILKKDGELQRINIEKERNARIIIEKQAETDKLLALARQEKDKNKQDSLRNLAKMSQLQTDNLLIKQRELTTEAKIREQEVINKQKEIFIERIILAFALVSILFLIWFAYIMRRSKLRHKNSKLKIKYQNEEIKQINEELHITLDTVNEQKTEIEHKNQAIEDSILYAQRIQQAILPLNEHILHHLPAHFVLFKPRDVVSGDFYYFEERKDKIILAAIDCTGHGIPGAFMTMIASEILNEIIQNKEIVEADIILNELHKRIRIALKQRDTNNRDGMDLALISIDKKNKTMDYAGAKNPLIYIQNNELHQIKGSKMPIGGEQSETERFFDKHTITLDVPTMIYLFSDGYQDQFGGTETKKFMIARMRDLLFQIHQQELSLQKEILEKNINEWMQTGNEKQIDDILVIGLRIDL